MGTAHRISLPDDGKSGWFDHLRFDRRVIPDSIGNQIGHSPSSGTKQLFRCVYTEDSVSADIYTLHRIPLDRSGFRAASRGLHDIFEGSAHVRDSEVVHRPERREKETCFRVDLWHIPLQ